MITHHVDYKILVAGAGSIGQRHIRNLRSMGVSQLTVVDPDPERLATIAAEPGTHTCSDFEEAIIATKPDIVFVCTPPVYHIPQATLAVQEGAHVFVEKPLSNTLEGVDDLIDKASQSHRVVQVGYHLRFHPGLQMVKQLVDDGNIGRILWARVEAGQYLPDWRPSQDYRQSYTARRELGGGSILDWSHEIDYTLWLLGQPVEVMCMSGIVSDLEVDTEDCATLLLRFSSGAQADIHLDFVQQGYSRSCKLAGERGTIYWEYAGNLVKIYRSETKSWEEFPYTLDADGMYVDEVEHFLDCVQNIRSPQVGLEQGKAVLKSALAAKSSALNGTLELIS